MRHTNLFVKVGRANPKPVCTVSQDSPSHDLQLDVQERRKFSELLDSGVDPERVEFSRESVDTGDIAPAPVARVTKQPRTARK